MALLAGTVLAGGTAVRAADCVPEPEITRQLPRASSGWSGSVCWLDGVIYEVTDAYAYAIMRDAETGAQIGVQNFNVPSDIQGISYDPWNDTWWLKLQGAKEAWEYNPNGTGPLRKVSTYGYAFGLYVDPDEEDVIWIAGTEDASVKKVDLSTGALLQTIRTTFQVRGVVRVGDYIWCARSGEVGDAGILIKIDMDGNEICRYYMPVSKYDHDTGGLSIDDEGQLWVEGGKGTHIYRLDVGYSPFVAEVTGHIDSGDYDGDGTSDIALFRPATSLWAVRGVTRCYYGTASSVPVSGDYNGDGTSDIATYDKTNSRWSVRGYTKFYYGVEDDYPVPGDYNGSLSVRAAVYRPSTGLWALRGLSRFYYGEETDLPIPGYFHSTYKSVKFPALFRGSSGLWLIRNLGNYYFGERGDTPVVADYNGDWVDDIGIFREDAGLWVVRSVTRSYFGQEEDEAVPADYLGDGTADIGIFRAASGKWQLNGVGTYFYGTAGDLPATGRLCFNPSAAAPAGI